MPVFGPQEGKMRGDASPPGPKAGRDASLAIISLNGFMIGLIAVTTATGMMVPMKGLPLYWHLLFGLLTVMAGIFFLVTAIFYLLASGHAIREAVKRNNLPSEIFLRTRQLKKELFPRCMGAIILLIAMTALGGAVHAGKAPKYVHLIFALLVLAVYLEAVRSMRKNFRINTELMEEAAGKGK